MSKSELWIIIGDLREAEEGELTGYQMIDQARRRRSVRLGCIFEVKGTILSILSHDIHVGFKLVC